MAAQKKSKRGSKSAQIRELLGTGMKGSDIAKKVGCTPGLVYAVKSQLGSKPSGERRGPGRPKGSKNKAKRGPGRPRKESTSSDSLGDLISMVKQLQSERDDALATLAGIQRLLG